jgi:hypothetical protein
LAPGRSTAATKRPGPRDSSPRSVLITTNLAFRDWNTVLPAIEEVLATSPEPGYVTLLASKLRPFVTQKEALLASSRHGQKLAIPDGR